MIFAMIWKEKIDKLYDRFMVFMRSEKGKARFELSFVLMGVVFVLIEIFV